MQKQNEMTAIYNVRELGAGKTLVLGAQHTFAMFGATVLVPLLTGLNVSTTLLCAGLGTLLFHFITGGKVPAFLGSSFAFLGGFGIVAPMLADESGNLTVPNTEMLPYACGGVVAAGLLYLVMSGLITAFGVRRIMRFFPPVVTGPIIIAIGLILAPSAINNCSSDWVLALIALGTVGVCNIWGKGMVKILPILIGVVVSYVAALIMGGVVCTALSTAGSFITDLKIGYWLGSTPKQQESFKFLGTLVSAATVAGVIMILNETYGFTSGQLAAPQANAMAAVIEPLMSGAGAPWLLYGIGAAIAVILTLFNVSALAFALGMFIPLELNLPLLAGGLINWFVTTRSPKDNVNKARGEKGTLIASGFIAGGALMGVVSAALRFGGISFDYSEWWANPASEWIALLMYVLLIAYMVKASMHIKK